MLNLITDRQLNYLYILKSTSKYPEYSEKMGYKNLNITVNYAYKLMILKKSCCAYIILQNFDIEL